MTNQPSGDDFVTHGQDTAKVTLTVDGKKLVREKGKGVNKYSLNKKEFHALGQGGIPEEVKNLLNVSPVNFQGQLDSAFWFHLTPGECAREINQIVNLSMIDDILDRCNTELKVSKGKATISKERLETNEKRLSQLDWIQECEQEYRCIEEQEIELDEIRSKTTLARDLIEDVLSHVKASQTLSNAILDGFLLKGLIEEWIKQIEVIVDTVQIIREYDETWEKNQRVQKELTQIKEKLDKSGPILCPVCNQMMDLT